MRLHADEDASDTCVRLYECACMRTIRTCVYVNVRACERSCVRLYECACMRTIRACVYVNVRACERSCVRTCVRKSPS